MEIHASCAARDREGVLLLGDPGAGKSDLVLRLLAMGFELVADDRVVVDGRIARPRPEGAGLLEIRGLGILRLPYCAEAKLRLAVLVGAQSVERMPRQQEWTVTPLPLIHVDSRQASAAMKVGFALDCVMGRVSAVAGALIP